MNSTDATCSVDLLTGQVDRKKVNFVWQLNITKFITNFVISLHFKVSVVLFELFPNDCNLQSNLTYATTQNFLSLTEGDRLGESPAPVMVL